MGNMSMAAELMEPAETPVATSYSNSPGKSEFLTKPQRTPASYAPLSPPPWRATPMHGSGFGSIAEAQIAKTAAIRKTEDTLIY